MVDVSLNNSMRKNLLSLQSIAANQSLTQNKLATGLRVNSAIDNPSSYYSASALNNKASDLSALLDSMTQGIQTIKTATETLRMGRQLLEQSKALANTAYDKITKPQSGDRPYEGPIAARVRTEHDLLEAIRNTSAADGIIVIDEDMVFSKNTSITLKEGQKLVGKNFADADGSVTKVTFDFDSTTNAIGIGLKDGSGLSDLTINYTSDLKIGNEKSHAVFVDTGSKVELKNLDITLNTTSSTLNSAISGIYNKGNIALSGKINITAPSKNTKYVSGIVSPNNTSILKQEKGSVLNINISGDVGYGIAYGTNHLAGTVNIKTDGTRNSGLYFGDHTISGTTNILSLGSSMAGINQATASVYGNLNVNLGSEVGTAIDGTHLNLFSQAKVLLSATGILKNAWLNYQQGALLGIKNPTNQRENGYWQANADQNNAVIGHTPPFNSLPDWVSQGDFPIDDFNDIWKKNFPEPKSRSRMATIFDNPAPVNQETVKEILPYQTQYNFLLKQFNQLINDGYYRGVNLLDSQSLSISFNERRSNNLEIVGVDASSKGLKINQGEWKSADDINNSITELEKAIGQLRGFENQFGSSYSIIENRNKFTEEMINVLSEGADKLTLADINAESANLLALKTRQMLAVNSLSLASQSGQSILKLF